MSREQDIKAENNNERIFERIRGSDGVTIRHDCETKKRCSNLFLHVAKAYCSTTVLHGCKYLSEPKRPVYERVAWFFILWGFVAVAVYMIWVMTEASLSKPVIINLDTSYHPIWNYQFPALSFCPLNKINKTLAENWVKNISLPPYLNRSELLELLPNILRLIDPVEANSKLEILHSVIEMNNLTAETVYGKIAVQCKDYLTNCKFKNRMMPCSSLFRTSRTIEGYCCSFNYFGLKSEYNMNVYHMETQDTPKSPVFMRSSGRETGLTVLVRTPEKDNFATLLSSTGTKLLIHKPLNYPDNLAIDKLVQTGRTGFFSVTPELINATPGVRKVPLEQRNCFFFDEKSLYSLRSYSYKNCIFNCRTNLFVKTCGCVPFIYPAPDNQRVCNLLDVPCLARNKYRFRTLGRNGGIEMGQGADVPAPCGCRPQCNDISYRIARSDGKMYIDGENLLQNDFYDVIKNISEYSEITVHFKSLFSTKYERIVYHNSYRLLASFGGLLGLFFGFSFVASFEAVYFFTLRVLFHIYMGVNNNKNEKNVTPPTSPTTVLGLYSRQSAFEE